VGLRPTFERVSVAGVFPRSCSMDVCGPLAHSVADVAILFNAMTGDNARNQLSMDLATEDITIGLDAGIEGLRLGVIENVASDVIDEEIASAVSAATGVFARLGADIRMVNIPLLSRDPDHSYPLTVLLYEFNQVLGSAYRSVQEPARKFGPIVCRDIEAGMRITRKDYEQALAARSALATEIREVFGQVDALLTPTMPNVAPLLTEPDLTGRHRQFTFPFSFVGLPAISIPCGFSAAGLPIGLQIVGDTLRDGLLLRIAAAYEYITDFHLRRPPLAFGSPSQ
jgi:aspartyl-tRNA(Asn)/glutamyl-tRNA(Gln) amidotransferase subunit A